MRTFYGKFGISLRRFVESWKVKTLFWNLFVCPFTVGPLTNQHTLIKYKILGPFWKKKKNLFIYMFWKNQCLFLETCPLVLWNNPFTFNLRSLETNFGANYGVIIAVQQLRKIIRHFAKYFTYQKQHEIYVEYYGAIFWRHNLPIQITLLSYIFCVEIFFWKIAGYPLTHTYIHKKYFASTQTHRNITK